MSVASVISQEAGDEIDKLIERILKSAANVYRVLGPGHSEVVYRNALHADLLEHKIYAICEVGMTVSYKGETVGRIQADLLVGKKVVVELKTQVTEFKEENVSQLHHYLLAGDLEHGVLINFPKRYLHYLDVITLRRTMSDEDAGKINASAFAYRQRNIQVFLPKVCSPFQFHKEPSP